VGELAKATGKTVRAIHLYEDLGLLSPTERSKGRFRLYDPRAIERVRWIAKLQTVGFSLPEIQSLVNKGEGAREAKEVAERLRSIFVEKLAEVQSRLSELRKLERELVSSLSYLDACQSACEPSAPLNSCGGCERHLDQPEPPPLVGGALGRSVPSKTKTAES
jgi:DNA-binding transcriptional MerR regulator